MWQTQKMFNCELIKQNRIWYVCNTLDCIEIKHLLVDIIYIWANLYVSCRGPLFVQRNFQKDYVEQAEKNDHYYFFVFYFFWLSTHVHKGLDIVLKTSFYWYLIVTRAGKTTNTSCLYVIQHLIENWLKIGFKCLILNQTWGTVDNTQIQKW